MVPPSLISGREKLKPFFFRAPADLRKWFGANHASAGELWIGFFKKSSGKPSVTWPQSVDEALCVGWIDGIRKSLDEESYVIRFTPRKPGSIWSAINIRRARELDRVKRMRPAGRKAFATRRENRSGVYSYEQRPASLVEPYRSVFQKNKKAWAFFEAQPPGYRKTVTWWVISAKKDETRLKRLEQLIEDSARGRRVGQFRRP
jgi:uncharacterized protein YdeI (YjbR/CyaY-like superfamily)